MKKCFVYWGDEAWNNISTTIKSRTSVSNFRIKMEEIYVLISEVLQISH